MDFELSEQHKMLKELMRDFMEKEIAPFCEQIDKTQKLPDGIWKKLADLDLLCVSIPRDYGGPGLDYLAELICCEEASRICPALAMSCSMGHSVTCADNILRSGTEEQRKKYLPPMCRGEKIGAFALTEPNAGSDAVAVQTTARRDGDSYVINGTKTFITNGSIADVFVLVAKTDVEAGARGISTFIVEKGSPGHLETSEFDKMGFRGATTAELSFQDYRVPAENILGEENKGVRVMMAGLDVERAIGCGLALGISQRALELSLEYAKQRVQFGQPISHFQLIQEKLADMYTMMEAGRLLAYEAITLAQNAEGKGEKADIHKIAAAALLLCGDASEKAAWEAVQIHGGYGYMMEHPVNRLFRDSRLESIGAGTREIRKLIIATELLKVPR